MIDFINIGALLFGKLNAIAKTYPLVAENQTKFPFIIYKTNQQRPIENKDICYEWIYNIQVNIVDDKYDSVCTLCNEAVKSLLELNEGFDINIESISEDYIDDAYVKTIEVQIKI